MLDSSFPSRVETPAPVKAVEAETTARELLPKEAAARAAQVKAVAVAQLPRSATGKPYMAGIWPAFV
jgi:hypothetical protein